MKNLIFFFLFSLFPLILTSQIRIVSWNIQHLGKSKNDQEIAYIAQKLKDSDIVALQEIVAGYGGAQAVARLARNLNRLGSKWDYVISSPTKSSPHSAERYAFLWKTAKIKIIGKPWLDQNYIYEIEREPFMIRFKYNSKEFTLVNFHAIPKSKQPEREIKYFKFFPNIYKGQNLIFLGDFNTNERNTVFNPLKKMGYIPVFNRQKTSLRTRCFKNDCLASELDNMFFSGERVIKLTSGIISFYKDFVSLKLARKISDHVPIYFQFDWK